MKPILQETVATVLEELTGRVLFNKGIQNCSSRNPIREQKRILGQSSTETITGAHRRPKWVPHYGAQADSGRAQDAQALLRLCSGILRHTQALIRYAHPRLRYAHPQLRYAHPQLKLKQPLLTPGD
jgi:hypothetical protein